ncbi:hypothetical protein LDZ77_24470 [Bacteroides xylanisolvens]|uniref:Uncharacterized protein n=1 Tax=Bacteroides xylanisolvens TaxID=371601 RepID=A0AAW4T3J9_9BACE|nr:MULTISPECIES: hypothetical protein [Bacteroides]MCA4535452.1 hypothetical protein [Bacteroides xylanisolvens]MCA4553511.1 hypothetical protein [Bacteroides xylanisolvens]MCA4567116.1 hypothetical protein [Bacteroides xylanisolvens]MCA4571998.1 hypothetical protein [Bacteroides xylanisolvens]MCA4602563.1 hypothetical protein [Bacteroides xylanisolvens]
MRFLFRYLGGGIVAGNDDSIVGGIVSGGVRQGELHPTGFNQRHGFVFEQRYQ